MVWSSSLVATISLLLLDASFSFVSLSITATNAHKFVGIIDESLAQRRKCKETCSVRQSYLAVKSLTSRLHSQLRKRPISDNINLLQMESISRSTQEHDVSTFHQVITFIGKSASTFVSVSFFLLLAFRRDALLATLFIGSICNALSSKVLKKILNHERPKALRESKSVKLKPSDGGMPSSHAMSLGFIGTAITCAIVPSNNQLMIGLLMAFYAAAALKYRVRDHLHTVDQVSVGLALGVLNALLWLKLAVGVGYSETSRIMSWVQRNWVSSETGLIPYKVLIIPVLVGMSVVGTFERRISLWIRELRKRQ